MIGGMIVDDNGQTKTLVHYAYVAGKIMVRGVESYRVTIACLGTIGNAKQFSYSCEAQAANCPRCRATSVFRESNSVAHHQDKVVSRGMGDIVIKENKKTRQ